ncbi:MAG: FKBP-type peptidyl-prolyl cis-trans isomerase [Vampirovibrionales bacterium]|nr:FKBP-type peptidyl-prolyl cis-trans isomerase [Vampirovibrionales bacterium]
MTGWPNTFSTPSETLPLVPLPPPVNNSPQGSPATLPPSSDQFQLSQPRVNPSIDNPNPHVYMQPKYNWLQKLITFDWVDRSVEKSTKSPAETNFVYNPQATQPVQRLVDHLLHSNGVTKRYMVVMVNDPDYNAFVTEDGLVYLNEGFLKKVKNPTEMAFVLAHELSHVISKDASKTDKIASQMSYATYGLLGAGTVGLGLKQRWPVKQWAIALGNGIGQLFDKTLYTQTLPKAFKQLPTLFKTLKTSPPFWKDGLKQLIKAPLTKALFSAAVLYGAVRFVSQLVLDKAVCRREDEADLRAVSMLRNAGIDPKGIETFQQSLEDAEKESKKFWRTQWKKISRDHTRPDKRMHKVATAVAATQGFGPLNPQPALTPAEWQQIQTAMKPRLAQLTPLPSLPSIGQAVPTANASTKPNTPISTTTLAFTQTPSGLQYADMVAGTGATATAGQQVAVHYTGTLYPNGKQFDSSLDRGEPFTFTLGGGEVIKGWDEGVAGMKVGGKRTLIIPSKLAYGAQGAGNDIPPNATLKFDIELLGTQ